MTVVPAGELLPGHDLVQLFRAPKADCLIISCRLATYQRAVSGTVTLAVHRVVGPASALGACLAQRVIAGDDIEDNGLVDLHVDVAGGDDAQLLAVRISTDGTQSGHAPTVWISDDGRIDGHVACFMGGAELGGLGLQGSVFAMPLTAPDTVPVCILYSPVTQCNMNCIHCISRDTRKTASRLGAEIKAQIRGWAEAGKLRAASSDYSGDILWADFRFGGELQFLIDLGIQLQIDTNGAYLTAEASERLCGANLHSVNISLDAAVEATYQRVRKGAPPLDEVCANIAGLVQARARHRAAFGITMSFTLMRSTLAEWPAFLRLAAGLGVDSVQARHLEAYTADMEPDSLWHDRAGFNVARVDALALAARLGIGLAAPPPFGERPQSGHTLCRVPWEAAVVLGNGDVAACCVPGMTMGNLHEATMEEIWNGPGYRRLRATVNSPDAPRPCRSCPMFRMTDNRDSYLIHSAMTR